ncbi:hypothetical protein IW261DRAFT_1577467 [Armillaria novae-zelandiae]|uniref:Piwi domain-containing protein n=1 Tax=Armillaria novae-zelandiae TaxID=153914 RepID=A0AA39TQS2_9AGAR|nr:hypothetical protein IW261DRAFT_1577467 [Armillaria novae-zelandiae]
MLSPRLKQPPFVGAQTFTFSIYSGLIAHSRLIVSVVDYGSSHGWRVDNEEGTRILLGKALPSRAEALQGEGEDAGEEGGGVLRPEPSPIVSMPFDSLSRSTGRRFSPSWIRERAQANLPFSVNACEMDYSRHYGIPLRRYDFSPLCFAMTYAIAVAMEKPLSAAFNLKLIEALQSQHTDVFMKAAVYDGKKNLYTSYKLDFGGDVSSGSRASNFKIKITEAREINMEVLRRYTEGQQSWDENISTGLTALNISFYSDKIKAPLANTGLEAWQGYFQSVRPALNRLLVNIDISTGVMFKPGPLIETCLEFITGNRREAFLSGVKVQVQTAAGGEKVVTIHKLTERDAASTANQRLRLPNIICIQTAGPKVTVIPLERCSIIPGQLSRAELNPEATWGMVKFATKRPDQRLSAIQTGIQVLAYGQSRYVRDFGLDIKTGALPMEIPARMINAPELKYGPGSKQLTVRPEGWSLEPVSIDLALGRVDKRFSKPMLLGSWMVVIFVPQRYFRPADANGMIAALVQECQAVGMQVSDKQPPFVYANAQSNIDKSIMDAVAPTTTGRRTTPTFIVCILPDRSNADLYTAVKQINAKLGGVNVIPDPKSVPIIYDPKQPTIVMGADVMHPAPGSQSPSYAAVVANIDSNAAQYAAKTKPQLGRQEMIVDLRTMAATGVSEGEFKRVLDLAACVDAEISPPPKITLIVVGKRHYMRFFPKNDRDKDARSGNILPGTVIDQAITNPVEFDFYLQSHGGILGTSKSSHYNVVHDDLGSVRTPSSPWPTPSVLPTPDQHVRCPSPPPFIMPILFAVGRRHTMIFRVYRLQSRLGNRQPEKRRLISTDDSIVTRMTFRQGVCISCNP